MKNTKRLNCRISHLTAAVILAAVLLFGTCMTAFAAGTGTPDPDFNEKGSITVTLHSEEADAIVTDGALTLYQVADLYLDDGNMACSYTEDWDGCSASLEDPTIATLASDLAAYAEDNGIAGIQTLDVNEDGSVTFTGLPLGLYLVIQTTQSEGYFTVDPFVVTVPIAGESGWIYNADASPKVEVYIEPKTPEEPTPTDNPETPVPTGSILPQTGQLVWPVPVLAAAGVLFCIIGVRMRRKGSRIHA